MEPHDVLLTGASGFVGRHLYPALAARGHAVRCGTRHLERDRERHPDRDWVHCDVSDPDALFRAVDGCRFAYYLVHDISGDRHYPEREARAARCFAAAARRAGVERVVYLGGVAPAGVPSRHLASRLETGRILRSESPTVELRAAMIIGAGSASWLIVRDLAARLPAMVLPKWLLHRSSPVAVDDVVAGLVAALGPRVELGAWDLAGPECLTHRELLLRVAARLGKSPLLVNVPVLTPHLSSYWIALVTRAKLDLASELVHGLQCDLLPDPNLVLWQQVAHPLVPLDRACDQALADERATEVPSAATRARVIQAIRELE